MEGRRPIKETLGQNKIPLETLRDIRWPKNKGAAVGLVAVITTIFARLAFGFSNGGFTFRESVPFDTFVQIICSETRMRRFILRGLRARKDGAEGLGSAAPESLLLRADQVTE